MNKTPIVIAALLALAAIPTMTIAHGSCAHEAVHTYGVPGSVGGTVYDPNGQQVASPGAGFVTVNDSETGDCDGDGVAFDFDGDLDVGVGGFAFGHGPWATHCGFHQEAAGTTTVTDLVFGQTVAYVTGSGDTNSWVADPTTGENTCVTDGVISPGTDLEGDDCLGAVGTGVLPVTCPGGGDGLLWGFVSGLEAVVGPSPGAANPATTGTVTSP